MNTFLYFVCAAVLFSGVCTPANAKVTKAQMEQTGKVIRSVCQPKLKVEDEPIDAMKQGIFPDDNKDLRCYIGCVMNMMRTMKAGKVNYDAAIKQIDVLMPDNLKEPTKKSLTECRYAGENYSDLCDAAYYTAKCVYISNPKNYFFP